MQYSPEQANRELGMQTAELLGELRERRNFEPANYLEAKTTLLNNYMRESSLSSCAVAVSGGIDSALVLGIINAASNAPDSPIKNIFPIGLPVFRDEFTKNQDEATTRGREVCKTLGLELIEIDLTKPYDAMKKAVDEAVGIEGEPWAAGQLVAYLRTPANYYVTSLMTQLGSPGVLCGTTNRDEGAYLGYVGKASDGIVDLQLISDLHKSEVRELAKFLGIPESILEATPTGDMYDGRIDEEVFGTSYDHVELLLLLKSLVPSELNAYLEKLDDSERKLFEEARANLEALHGYNAHKYRVGSPAVHLDIMESGVPGGWSYAAEKVDRTPLRANILVNEFSFSEALNERMYMRIARGARSLSSRTRVGQVDLINVDNAINKYLINTILDEVDAHGWQPVGIDGIARNYQEGDEVGSLRASTFSPELADYLWARVSSSLDSPQIFGDNPQVDVEPQSVWRPIGISPAMRFIRYDQGGSLIPHYDAPHIYSGKLMTLKSLVAYLDAREVTGGDTRFLFDDRVDQPVAERDMSDRENFAREEDVMLRVSPKVGSLIIFDHRNLHDSEPIVSNGKGRKVILRTDVVYARC